MSKKILNFLLIALSLPVTAFAQPFPDVQTDTDYYHEIYWTVDQGITSGYEDGNWGPDNCVTRAEMLKMLVEYKNLINVIIDQGAYFTDVKKGDWFYEYVRTAKDMGIVEGYADGSFRPNQCMNRVEGMKIAAETLFDDSTSDGMIQSSAPLYYDDKAIVDMSGSAWYSPYARFMFENRLIGSKHTSFVEYSAELRAIKFFPAEPMTRKEVAYLLSQINQYHLTHPVTY